MNTGAKHILLAVDFRPGEPWWNNNLLWKLFPVRQIRSVIPSTWKLDTCFCRSESFCRLLLHFQHYRHRKINWRILSVCLSVCLLIVKFMTDAICLRSLNFPPKYFIQNPRYCLSEKEFSSDVLHYRWYTSLSFGYLPHDLDSVQNGNFLFFSQVGTMRSATSGQCFATSSFICRKSPRISHWARLQRRRLLACISSLAFMVM